VTDDVIMEQVETTYDNAGNVIQTTRRQRYHNAPDTQTGALQNPSTTPKARVTYSTAYSDSLGRTVASVDYGTNGGGTFSRPDTIPARSDSVLVSSTSFDAAGNVAETVDPSGMVTQYEYDDAGRKTAVIENVQDGSSSSSSSSSSGDGCDPSDDANRTTRCTYMPDGQQATLTAVNPRTGDQTTTWSYGTTFDDSEIAMKSTAAVGDVSRRSLENDHHTHRLQPIVPFSGQSPPNLPRPLALLPQPLPERLYGRWQHSVSRNLFSKAQFLLTLV
jgi:YD repeat-containing protein